MKKITITTAAGIKIPPTLAPVAAPEEIAIQKIFRHDGLASHLLKQKKLTTHRNRNGRSFEL